MKPNKKLSLLDEYNKLREEGREKGFIPVLVSYDILTINSMKSNIGIIESTVSEVKKTVKDYHKKMLAMTVADGKVFLHKNWTQEPTDEEKLFFFGFKWFPLFCESSCNRPLAHLGIPALWRMECVSGRENANSCFQVLVRAVRSPACLHLRCLCRLSFGETAGNSL